MVNFLHISIKSFNGIGDLLFATPTIRKIKETYGDIVKIFVNTNYPQLLELNPYVFKVSGEGISNESSTFLGYPDPIHCVNPTQHHILSDYEIIKERWNLVDLEPPELKPEIYIRNGIDYSNGKILIQCIHKGHWHKKKVWPKFNELLTQYWDGEEYAVIPKVPMADLVSTIRGAKAVICAEGGISHIARAVGTPAIVIYGGFAKPEWNGYKEQINITNEKSCSYCYNPRECIHPYAERLCMKEITIEMVLKAVRNLSKRKELSNHNNSIFVLDDASRWCFGKGLDIGGGNHPFPGARNIELDRKIGEDANHILEKTNSQDFIFSSHCLEHLEDDIGALAEWWRVLKEKGILYLYLPHPNYIPWRKESMPKWHKHNYYEGDIIKILTDPEGRAGQWEIEEIVPFDNFGSQKIIAKKIRR